MNAAKEPERRDLRGGELTTTILLNICTACGCVIGREDADWKAHLNWHRLLRNLATGGAS